MKDTLYIFDIDGTLTDSVPMYLISVTKAMQALGIVNIDTDYNNYKHHTDSYALRYNYERNFNRSVPKDLLDKFEDNLILAMNDFDPVKEISGAKELIDRFRGDNIPFCFATGALPKPALQKLNQCDIWCDEGLLATSKTHESREGFVKDAIDRAKSFYDKTDFENIVSLGDGLWDLKTAQNLSLDFVGIGDKNKRKLIDNGATRCYPNLIEFSKELF